MNPLILAPILEIGKQIIDRAWPDKTKQSAERAAAELELRKLALDAESRITNALAKSDENQTEVNKIEAASADPFVSRWRPSVGWVCSFAFAVQFVVIPLGTWIAALAGNPIDPPMLDGEQLTTILLGMLGLGAYRSFEKVKGVTR